MSGQLYVEGHNPECRAVTRLVERLQEKGIANIQVIDVDKAGYRSSLREMLGAEFVPVLVTSGRGPFWGKAITNYFEPLLERPGL